MRLLNIGFLLGSLFLVSCDLFVLYSYIVCVYQREILQKKYIIYATQVLLFSFQSNFATNWRHSLISSRTSIRILFPYTKFTFSHALTICDCSFRLGWVRKMRDFFNFCGKYFTILEKKEEITSIPFLVFLHYVHIVFISMFLEPQ
jgi:hypothetical protein